VGGLATGRISDRLGRKAGMLTCVARGADARGRSSPGVCARHTRVARSSMGVNAFFALLVCRVLAGMGVGASIAFEISIEYLPLARRGFCATLISWFWMLGTMLSAGAG
jgi:MFS family permease